MTNKERDALLISMSKGINNLYNNFFSLEKNLQKKIEDTSEKTENNLRSEIKNTENRLRAEFKTEIKNTEKTLRAEIKNTEDKLRDEMNSQNQINITSIVDAFHETWRIDSRERNIINKRLDQHDKEIKVLKERLA